MREKMQTRKDAAVTPYSHEQMDGSFISEEGLTKREYFAAIALQGILSNPELCPDRYNPGENAVLAIEAADLLIYHLNNSHTPLER
jgi:hypothetical protein